LVKFVDNLIFLSMNLSTDLCVGKRNTKFLKQSSP